MDTFDEASSPMPSRFERDGFLLRIVSAKKNSYPARRQDSFPPGTTNQLG